MNPMRVKLIASLNNKLTNKLDCKYKNYSKLYNLIYPRINFTCQISNDTHDQSVLYSTVLKLATTCSKFKINFC